MFKKEYIYPALITLGITGVAWYFVYMKYKPSLDALNTLNRNIGTISGAVSGAVDGAEGAVDGAWSGIMNSMGFN